MDFISKEDFQSHMYEGLIDRISDNDDDILTDAIATAMATAEGYLSRFNTDQIFESTDKVKYADLRTYIKDIAKWHFIKLCNVSVDMENAKINWKAALAGLKEIQAGISVKKGWPLASEDSSETDTFTISSSEKRGNYLY